MTNFGRFVRERREALRRTDPRYSVRQVAQRIGVQPSYLSKVERGQAAPPSETTIHRLALELEENSDVLLAMAGKVSSDLQEAIRKVRRKLTDTGTLGRSAAQEAAAVQAGTSDIRTIDSITPFCSAA